MPSGESPSRLLKGLFPCVVARLKVLGLPFDAVGGVIGVPNAGCRMGEPGLEGANFAGGILLLNDGEDIDGGDMRPGEFRAEAERE